MNMPIQNSSLTRQLPQGLALEHADADAFEQEIAQYLGKYPQTEHIDICLHDLNGHIRGKRIELNALKKLAKGCYFPLSVYAMNLEGKVVAKSGTLALVNSYARYVQTANTTPALTIIVNNP